MPAGYRALSANQCHLIVNHCININMKCVYNIYLSATIIRIMYGFGPHFGRHVFQC